MVERTAATRIISFLLLAVCGAWCQSESCPADLPQDSQSYGSTAPEAQRQELRAQISLPDAPSVQPPTQAEKWQAFVEDASSPLTFGAVGISAVVMREEEEHLARGRQSNFTALYGAAALQKESSLFFGKYLYPSLLKQDPRYHPSASDSILGRATYAASRVLITRNDSGKRTLNTSYWLGVLTAAAVATAYRPYWARSSSTMFKDFGSTVGSDVGTNLFHEFWPGIRQMLKGQFTEGRGRDGRAHHQRPDGRNHNPTE